MKEAGLSKKDSETALNAAITAIGDALAKGEAVQLIGFGTFGVKERAAREGRTPVQVKLLRLRLLRCLPSRQEKP